MTDFTQAEREAAWLAFANKQEHATVERFCEVDMIYCHRVKLENNPDPRAHYNRDDSFLPNEPFPVSVFNGHIEVSGCNLVHVDCFEPLRIIESLYLQGNQLENVNGLQNIISARDLQLGSNKLTTLSPMRLASIERLGLAYNKLSDIEQLSGVMSLDAIDIRSNAITSLRPLSSNQFLSEVQAAKNKLVSLDGLQASLVGGKLRLIDASSNLGLNLDALIGVKTANELVLGGCGIKDLNALGMLQAVEDLHLDHNELTSLSPLTSLEQVGSLSVSNNQLKNLKGLDNVRTINHFNARHNALSDLSDFNPSTPIQRVDLRDNKITSVRAIRHLSSSGYLGLNDNPAYDKKVRPNHPFMEM